MPGEDEICLKLQLSFDVFRNFQSTKDCDVGEECKSEKCSRKTCPVNELENSTIVSSSPNLGSMGILNCKNGSVLPEKAVKARVQCAINLDTHAPEWFNLNTGKPVEDCKEGCRVDDDCDDHCDPITQKCAIRGGCTILANFPEAVPANDSTTKIKCNEGDQLEDSHGPLNEDEVKVKCIVIGGQEHIASTDDNTILHDLKCAPKKCDCKPNQVSVAKDSIQIQLWLNVRKF